MSVPACPNGSVASSPSTDHPAQDHSVHEQSQENALQTLLAFSALHEHVHQKELLANCQVADAENVSPQFNREQFVLDEVLQLVAERALAITGADGLMIALAENEEIVSRVAAGTLHPDLGIPLDRDSAFSVACFSSAQIWRCDDTETDARVNLQACRGFGARSIVAVPLCGRLHTIGLLEAFSVEPFGFSDSDVINLRALADLVVGAMNPDEEDWFAVSAQLAARKLKLPLSAPDAVPMSIDSLEAGRLEPASAAPTLADPLKEEVALPTAILHQTPIEPKKTSLEFGPADAVERLPESAITAENLDATPRGSRKPIWLFCIVIAVVFAVLAGWRLRMHMDSASKQGATLEPGHAINLPLKPRASRMFPQVTGIRHWATDNSSTVVIEVEDQVQYETHRLVGPDRIYLDLHDTKLSSELPAKPIEVRDPVLKHIRIGQPAVGTTRIVLVTKDHTEFSVRLEPNPYQLVIELKKSGEITGSH